MTNLLIKNTTIITGFHSSKVLTNASVLIEEGLITKIYHDHETCPKGVHTLSGEGQVLLPGFINAHTHFYSAFARGFSKMEPAHNFAEILKNLWWKLDRHLTPEACYYSALLGCIEAIKSGTTTVIDHHAAPSAFSLNRLSDAVDKSGIRACLCYEVSDRDGQEIAARGIRENIDFLKNLKLQTSDRIKGLFGLHASFTVSEATLNESVQAMKLLDSGFHIHLAEDVSDQLHSTSQYGCRVTERLDRAGALNSNSVLAHGVHLDQNELAIIKDRNCCLIHNAQSNMNNGVGIADLEMWQNAGITFGLGTDAMTYNMLEELRSAIWLQKLKAGDPSHGFNAVTSALLEGNPEIARRIWDLPLGEIKPGNPADLVLFKYQPYTDLNDENIAGHLVFGISQVDANTTIVNGKPLMINRELTELDETAINCAAKPHADQLWKAMLS